MPRVAGVDIPANKRLWISLQYVYGIGDAVARKICEQAGVDSFRKTSELTDEELARINTTIDRDFLVVGHWMPASLRTAATAAGSSARR